jgi:benzoate-CoA ligase family protein
MRTAEELGVPRLFNAATYFVDRHLGEGRGEHVAIECGDEQVRYRDLHANANRFGSALRNRLEVRPEERVMLMLLDTTAFAYAFFGAMKIGAVAVPTNTLLKPPDYRFLLEDSRASILVISEALLPMIADLPRSELRRLRHVIVDGTRVPAGCVGFEDVLNSGTTTLDAEPTTRDDAALWLYSSGSTGVPKACVHLHHDMVVCAELFGKGVLGITPADRTFSVAKLFFAYGLGNALYFPLAVGATTILHPGPPTAARVFEIIERHRPTIFYSVPTAYGMLLAETRSPEFDLSSVRLAVSAGEALPPALFDRFKARFGIEILDGIGSTEALHMFISNRPDAVKPGSSGQLVAGYDARILDDHGQQVPDGEIGNLWVGGDSVCAAYWNQHQKSMQTIQGSWLRTGDKYRRDADGWYWYAGRTDDMLKVGGQWVSPVEVENALIAHPAVQECAVIGDEGRDGLVKPIAFVVTRAGVREDEALALELETFVRSRLADFKRPRRVVFARELPKTATGKIQRFKLRELARQANRAAG